jgi:Mce-associated membrane protein
MTPMTRTDDEQGGFATALPVVLALVLVVLLSLSAWRWLDDDSPSRAGVMTTARDAALRFFTFDADDPERTVDGVLAVSTGRFRKEYAGQRKALVRQVAESGLDVSAAVDEDGLAVEHLSERDARVLVALDTETRLPNGGSEAKSYRIRVLLQREGDAWLLSGMEQVG